MVGGDGGSIKVSGGVGVGGVWPWCGGGAGGRGLHGSVGGW